MQFQCTVILKHRDPNSAGVNETITIILYVYNCDNDKSTVNPLFSHSKLDYGECIHSLSDRFRFKTNLLVFTLDYNPF